MRTLIYMVTMAVMLAGCAVNNEQYRSQVDMAVKAQTHEEAIKLYEAAAKKSVNTHFYYEGRADVHYYYGYFGEAGNDYTRALRISGDTLYNLKRGRSYLRLHFYEDAVIDFTSVVSVSSSKYPVAYVERAKAYAAQGDYANALQDLEKAKKTGGENRDFLKAMAELNFKMGRYDDAKVYIQKAIIGTDDDAELFHIRGKVFYRLKDANQAVSDLKKALELDRGNNEAKRMLAWIYATNPLESYRNGREALRMAKELYSMDGEIQYIEVLAAAYAENDEFDKAVDILEEGIRLTSDLVQKEDFRFDIKNYKEGKKIRIW